jgi:CelD/BcsL family acetyltransferase involved in cellulose biosynthesis
MIHTLTLERSGHHTRPSKPGDPAEIFLVRSVSELSMFWPRSNQPHVARCYAFQYADILEVRCATIAAARHVDTLFVAVVDSQRQPLMLLPWGIERRWGVRVLSFLDGGLSDYNAPIIFPAAQQWGEDDMRSIWQGLRRILPPFDVAILDKMPENVGDLPNPLNLLGTVPFLSSGHATTLAGSWREFEAQRLPRRQDSRRKRRRLQDRGTLSFEIATNPEQFDVLLAALIRQKVRHHRETLTIAGFDQPGYRAFVTQITHQLPAGSPVHLSALKLDDMIIAAQWGYVAGGRFYYLIPSYEAGMFRSFSPARILLEHLLEWSYAHGVTVFDFGLGDESYKTEYCDVLIPLRVAAKPVNPLGAMYLLAMSTGEKIARHIRDTSLGMALKRVVRRDRSGAEQHAECAEEEELTSAGSGNE